MTETPAPTAGPSTNVAVGTPMAVGAIVSVQLGAAVAVHLFPLVGPVGAVTLRLVGASVALVAVTRPWRSHWSVSDLRASLLLGIVLVSMNVCLYSAIDRLPLATGITLEYLGPLGLTLATAGSWRRRVWAAPTAAGVLLLGGSLRLADVTGVAFALAAAVLWACYIVLNRRLGRGGGLAGLGLANLCGAALVLPFGVAAAGSALWRPEALLLGLAVGVLSSAAAYSLDLLALRRLPTAVFGVLTGLNPVVAALVGIVLLGQGLTGADGAGIALVVGASAGMTLTRVPRALPGPPPARPAPGSVPAPFPG